MAVKKSPKSKVPEGFIAPEGIWWNVEEAPHFDIDARTSKTFPDGRVVHLKIHVDFQRTNNLITVGPRQGFLVQPCSWDITYPYPVSPEKDLFLSDTLSPFFGAEENKLESIGISGGKAYFEIGAMAQLFSAARNIETLRNHLLNPDEEKLSESHVPMIGSIFSSPLDASSLETIKSMMDSPLYSSSFVYRDTRHLVDSISLALRQKLPNSPLYPKTPQDTAMIPYLMEIFPDRARPGTVVSDGMHLDYQPLTSMPSTLEDIKAELAKRNGARAMAGVEDIAVWAAMMIASSPDLIAKCILVKNPSLPTELYNWAAWDHPKVFVTNPIFPVLIDADPDLSFCKDSDVEEILRDDWLHFQNGTEDRSGFGRFLSKL